MFAAVATMWAGDARAQTDNRLALGGAVTTRAAGSSGASASSDVSLEVRLGHEREGWRWADSFFSWFDTDIQDQAVAPASDFGKLRMRPVMAGYGYTHIRGRAAVTTALLGGYSFNSFHLDPSAIAEYQRRGASNIRSDATNTFVIKPEVQVWYDLTPRYGIRVSAGYLIARPTVTIGSSLGVDTRDLHANTFLFTIGVVYSIM
jgi:hypothetical protein